MQVSIPHYPLYIIGTIPTDLFIPQFGFLSNLYHINLSNNNFKLTRLTFLITISTNLASCPISVGSIKQNKAYYVGLGLVLELLVEWEGLYLKSWVYCLDYNTSV